MKIPTLLNLQKIVPKTQMNQNTMKHQTIAKKLVLARAMMLTIPILKMMNRNMKTVTRLILMKMALDLMILTMTAT